MGEDVGSGSRPNSSAVKSREAKKRAALWKKQVKSFKLKDVDKKVDAVRFCAQDERFFREQAEVLPLLMGFLSRTKTPELVRETLNVMHTLLSSVTITETSESNEGIHPEVNASFMLDRSVSVDSAWKAGEPFINLFSMNALAPEIRIKAIEVYSCLLRASVALSESAGEATPTLLQFQSVGSPCSALLGCLSSGNGDLEFEALSCLRLLLRNPPSEEFLDKFEAEKGISWSLKFLTHSERRFHRPALDIVESFSHFECGRLHLKTNEAAPVLRNAIQEAHEMIQKTSAVVPVSGMDGSPLSVKDAAELCSNIGIICQVFVRATLAKEQVATNSSTDDIHAVFMDAIDAMIGILRYDIATALTPPVLPSESPRTTPAATAAANAAAANAAALASLIPFSIDRGIAVISSIGRMIEYSEQLKAHAKTKGLLPILFDCLQVKEAHKLYQVTDKLLHLCIHVNDVDKPECTRLDPQVLCSVTGGLILSGDDEAVDVSSPSVYEEKPPLLAVDTVLALLETSVEAANNELLFRVLRWIAVLVDLPGNASALGEKAVSISLQVLSTASNDKLLFAFLAKSIHAIILQNSGAFELCGSSGHEPSNVFFEFLLQKSEITETTELDSIQPTEDKADHVSNYCKLEWVDEYEEEAAFEPKPLMEALHNIDVYLAVAEALAGLTNAFLKWNPVDTGSTTVNFNELIAARLHADASPGKPGAPTAGGSKKKLATDPVKSAVIGEVVMLCILEKGLQVAKLVSKYAAVNPAVCVSMLGLLDNLMAVPSGMTVLLHLAKLEVQQPDQLEPCQAVETEEWPLSVEKSSQMEHTLLLLPVLNVLQCPDTSFIEIEASVRTLAVMTSDPEPFIQAPPPEPVEVAKSPTKSGVAVVPPPAVPSVPEMVTTESDRFINAAIGCGALVILLAFLDLARIPKEIPDFSARANIMKLQIEEMVQKFITLAQIKQENIGSKYREKLALLNIDDTAPPEAEPELNLPYQTRWAQLLLDRKFSVPRFGYVDYTALLLASELALSTLVTTLLGAGASSNIASPDGVTPLMIAFLIGNEEIVIDLLDVQSNVDAITTDGHDLTVWNCALVSPVKARVSQLIAAAYTCSEGSVMTDAHIQLDSIEGSLQFLDMCLDAGVDANVSNAQGDFLLHSLLSKSIVRRKLRGLDVCFRYNSYYEDQRRLQRAVVDLIQNHSANVNSCNRMGQTPLHLALLYGYTGIVKILLDHGANPNVQGIYGHLPLHYACLGFCGSLDGSDGEAIELTRLLLENTSKFTCILGAHTDRRKHKSSEEKQALAIETILENGLQSVIEPPSIVLKLATAQQILTTTSFMGKFLPWHFACGAYVQLSSVLCLDDDMQKWFEANGQARADIIRYLIREWKIDINSPASEGVTALHLSVKSDINGNNLPVIDLLLETTTNVNTVHDHILIDSLPVIPSGTQAVLLDGEERKPAFVSSRSIDGKYHILLEDGQHMNEVTRSQLQVLRDPEKKTSHHSHHYKYLLPMESRFSALHYALQSNQDTLALRLLAVPGISLDPDGSDLPLLALACAARQTPEVVSRLINQQANMRVHLPLRTTKCDLTTVDTDTSSSLIHRKQAAALHYAVMYDDYSMVEVLLTNSDGHVHPDVRRSGDGYTPLHLACQTDNLSIIKLLLDHGASLMKLSSMSAHGVSPLQLLIKFDSVDNDKLKDLIREKYLRPEMLLEGIPTTCSQVTLYEGESMQEDQKNDQEDSDVPACALLYEEELNLDLFDRLQGLNRDKRGKAEARVRRLEAELEKSDGVLCAFFDLFKQLRDINDPVQEDQSESSTLVEKFQQLQHRHECYRQFTTRSQWKPKNKVTRVVSKMNIEEGLREPTAL